MKGSSKVMLCQSPLIYPSCLSNFFKHYSLLKRYATARSPNIAKKALNPGIAPGFGVGVRVDVEVRDGVGEGMDVRVGLGDGMDVGDSVGVSVGVGVYNLLASPPPPAPPPLGGGVAVGVGVGVVVEHVNVPSVHVTVRSPVIGSFNLLGGENVNDVTQSLALQQWIVRLPISTVPLTVGCPRGLMKTNHSRPSILESHVPCHSGPYSQSVTLAQQWVYVRFT
jgi:hypothetical protein